MSLLKLAFSAIAPAIWLAASTVNGQSLTPWATTNSPSIKAKLLVGETVGNEQIRRLNVTYGTNLYVFQLPPNFTFDASNPEKLLLSNQKDGRFVTVQRITSPPGEGQNISPATCKKLIHSQFPQSKVESDFCGFALNRSGPAFDVQWNAAGTSQNARVVFIPISSGFLVFSLVAPMEKFQAAQIDLTIILGSLQSDENGKIEISPVPNFS